MKARVAELVGRFAEDLDARWSARDRRADLLPELAVAAFGEARLHEQIDPTDVIRWGLSEGPLPPQFDPQATFGHPPVTVWRNEHLLVDVYFWVTPEIGLHDHAFTGAFTNLVGHSLHAAYRFEERERPAPGVALGDVTLAHAEHLRPGSIEPIPAGVRLIHRVWHLSRPTVTMVARTPRQPIAQARYLLPSLALNDPYRDDARAERLQRRSQLLRHLVAVEHGDLDEISRELVLGAPPLEAFHHLEELVSLTQQRSDDRARLDALVGDLRRRHGEWIDVYATAIAAYAPLRAVRWDSLVAPGERLLVALMETLPSRGAIADMAARMRCDFPGVFAGTPTDWLSDALSHDAFSFKLKDDQRRVLLLLADGLDGDAMLERLSDDVAIDEDDAEKLLALAARLKRLPLLERLLA